MTTTDLSTLKVTSPAELVSAVPYLLGFHPDESLVAIGLDATKVVVAARINLPDLRLPGVLRTLFDALLRATANRAVIVVFSESDIAEGPMTEVLSETVQAAQLELLDILLVTGGRWRSLLCHNTSCCPYEGTALAAEPTVIATAAVHAGLSAVPNRDALAAIFEPIPGPDLSAELRHHQERQLQAVRTGDSETEDRSVVQDLVTAQQAAQGRRMPPDEDVARFAVALRSYSVRDAMWLAIDDGQLPGAELWVNLARRLPSPYDAAPLFLSAWSAYREGNGALAAIAAELALASDPDYSAAGLLLSALQSGVDPRTLPKLSAEPRRGGDEPTPA